MSSWILPSPGGTFQLTFSLSKQGGLYYRVEWGETQLLHNSLLGLVTDLGDFTKGLTLQNKREQFLQESYRLIGAKTEFVSAEANELVLSFDKGGILFQLIARAYGNGFAFRYSVQTDFNTALQIHREETTAVLPAQVSILAMPYTPHHESVAKLFQPSGLKGFFCLPVLFQEKKSGVWLLLSEAAQTEDYCGACARAQQDGTLQIGFPPEQLKAVSTQTPFFTPWRFCVVGSLADIVENTLAESLSPPCAIEDTAWIRPGVTAWSWLCREKTDDLRTYKRYVDLAAQMGWQYVLLDEGWQPRADKVRNPGHLYHGYYHWITELLDYAKEQEIGLLVWAHQKDFDTPEKQCTLAELAQMGFKGVKIDFFDSQSQKTMHLYDQLLRKTAQCKLLLNPHGANKTTGERRTWPHALTREGIFGAEQELGNPKNVTARHTCTLPYTRCAVGPADFTPMFSYRNSGENRPFTLAHMAALPLVLESGIPCLADRPESYLSSHAREWFAHFPAAFAETRFLGGCPGEYAAIARRSGETWYVGCICNTAQEAVIPLHFLQEGRYKASIWRDGTNPEEILTENGEVHSSGALRLPLAKTGGACVKLEKITS